MIKTWCGVKPKKCDTCGEHLVSVFVDGAIRAHIWGIMCAKCWAKTGLKLGLGRGQMYNLETLEQIKI